MMRPAEVCGWEWRERGTKDETQVAGWEDSGTIY